MAVTLIVLGTVAVHLNSLRVPFHFDDLPALVENPSIRTLASLGGLRAADQPGGLTTSGRPVLHFTFALNHAVGGYDVRGYHVVNVAIHGGAALLLLGLVRRTLQSSRLPAPLGAAAVPLATVVALLWALHPLQTESVTYIVQRAESLVAFFYLLTLYAFARGFFGLAVAACALGMGTKEVMVSAPLIVLLYDRTFVSGSFRAAWRAHARWHLLLMGTWLLLLALLAANANRGGTAGFATDISSWSYALTQCRALVHYVALAFWPAALVFDHGLATARGLSEVLPQALVVAGALAGTAFALKRKPALGFLCAVFFAVLAPSSSVVPVATQTMAEHRMYLALAPVVAALVIGGCLAIGRRILPAGLGLAAACGFATVARNKDYRSETALWSSTVARLPTNARAHNNLGQAQYRTGDNAAAIASYREALRLQPRYPETHYNLGVALAGRGELEAAIAHYEAALAITPDYPEALNNLGNALARAGRPDAARAKYEEAVRRRPTFAEAHNNLGNALLQADRPADARRHFERALALRPSDAETHYNLGNAVAAAGDMPGALRHFRDALRLNPRYAPARVNAGNALLELKRPAEALEHYEAAAAADPTLADAHFNRGSLLMDLGRWEEAIEALQRALPLARSPDIHRALGFASAQAGKRAEAIRHYETYLGLRSDDAEARAELAALRAGR